MMATMSLTEPTAAELLVIVNLAISKLAAKTVASYSVGGTSYTLADLGRLRELRADLSREVNAASTGGGVRLVSIGE